MRFGVSIGTVLLAALVLPGTHAVAQESEPGAAAIENVSVVPMDRERVIDGQTVVVVGRRIVAMGPAGRVDVPASATRIDGRGKYLIPGLAEMHGHIPSPASGPATLERVMLLNVLNGVTTIRGMLGHPSHLGLRGATAMGQRLGPQIFASSPSLNGNSVPDQATALRVVSEYRAAGFDLLKIHPGIQRDVFDVIAGTAEREKIPFAGHVPRDVGLEHALETGIATVEHMDGMVEMLAGAGRTTSSIFFGFNLVEQVDESRIAAVVEAVREAGAWVTPTQVLFENRFLGDPEQVGVRPEMHYVADSVVQGWVDGTRRARANPTFGYTPERARRFIELRRRLIKALHDGGAGLILGADAPQVFNVPGFATIQELSALVEAGLTPYEALETGTRNPAHYLGLEDSFGTIGLGKRADLLLLDANPLEDIANVKRVAGVMVAGRWLSKGEIESMLADLREW